MVFRFFVSYWEWDPWLMWYCAHLCLILCFILLAFPQNFATCHKVLEGFVWKAFVLLKLIKIVQRFRRIFTYGWTPRLTGPQHAKGAEGGWLIRKFQRHSLKKKSWKTHGFRQLVRLVVFTPFPHHPAVVGQGATMEGLNVVVTSDSQKAGGLYGWQRTRHIGEYVKISHV